jgi:hypothetical protein
VFNWNKRRRRKRKRRGNCKLCVCCILWKINKWKLQSVARHKPGEKRITFHTRSNKNK